MDKTNESYLDALKTLHEHGMPASPRGMQVKELLPCYTFIMDPMHDIITIPGFETNVAYAQEELDWYMAKTDKIDFSPLIERTWKQFSDDGVRVNSAYGHRIFGAHEEFRDQFSWCIKQLTDDPESRRAVININHDKDKDSKKDMPCTMFIQCYVRNKQLYWHTVMRSQDIYLGTRNDIYCFMAMQRLMAHKLNLKYGCYVHTCLNLHIYGDQIKKLDSLFS